MHRFVLVCLLAYVMSADVGLAQTATSIQGSWVAKTGDCGELKLRIASQSRSGVLTGTIECVRTGQVTRFGPQSVAGKQTTGKFDGTLVNIEGPQSLTSVKLVEDRKLVGFAYGVLASRTIPVAFVKQ